MMTFAEYQRKAAETAVYPRVHIQVAFDGQTGTIWTGGKEIPVYPALGLCGEAGEVIACFWAHDIDGLAKEIGDVLWYVAEIATCTKIDLGDWDDVCAGVHSFGGGEQLAVACAQVAEMVKKAWRDGDGVELSRAELGARLRSVLEELHGIAEYNDLTLEQCAEGNIAKLASRKARGVLSGSGDNR